MRSMKESGNEIILFLFMTFAFIYNHELLDHRLKQLNIGRSCWTQVEVTGLKVETADVKVSLFCISIYIIYVLLEVEDH